MKFQLPQLPYSYDALAPVIDAQTMETHHSKHHAAYTDKLNALLQEHNASVDVSIEEILAHISTYVVGIRNNAGGFYNHNLFWHCMTPQGSEMSESLQQTITAQFGSLEEFKNLFTQCGLSCFGSGWVWLGINDMGEMKIFSTANQDNPLMDVVIAQEGTYTPLLCLDVWEHAYYLTYTNARADYIGQWWSVVDWNQVEQRLI